MSDSENFLSRWARRKREAADTDGVAETASVTAPHDASEVPQKEPKPPAANTKPQSDAKPSPASCGFDLASLPPIESIGAGTDVRAFLAAGVPAELKRAALRRAWTADPAIRDFIGLSENSWDFNAPDGIPGFGPLQMSEELKQIVARLFTPAPGETAKDDLEPALAETPRPSIDQSAATDRVVATEPSDLPGIATDAAATEALARSRTRDGDERDERRGCPVGAAQQNDEAADNEAVMAKRSHGGALPR